MKKRFGQHFLQDRQVLTEMVAAISPHSNDTMFEIGPGEGVLTEFLISSVRQLTIIEIDRDLIPYLKQRFIDYPHLRIFAQDVLTYDFGAITNHKIRIVGNLPYNISTPLLFKLLPLSCVQDMHFLLQKEVVDRICAKPGGKKYGRLSVMTQYYCTPFALLDVAPEAFNPPPQVFSTFIRLIPKEPLLKTQNMTFFSHIVREAFNQRRKTLANALKKIISAAELISLSINPTLRAESITVEEFVKISNYCHTKNTLTE